MTTAGMTEKKTVRTEISRVVHDSTDSGAVNNDVFLSITNDTV